MTIDDRLRAGLPAALDDVRPDVDADLAVLLLRADRRARVRRAAYFVGLVAAAVVAVAILAPGGDDSQGSLDPLAPNSGVRVLDSGRGSAEEPAPLDPGRYAIPFLGAADDAPWGEVDVPASWGQDRFLLATGSDLDPRLRRVELLTVSTVAPDPCAGVMRPVGASVTEIVVALTEQRAVRPRGPRPVSIDGYPGQLVQFRVPSKLAVEQCWDGQSLKPFGVGSGYTSVLPGWRYRVWVLDVAGDTLAILAAHGPKTTQTELDELTAMVEGITFVAPR
jgi:hypothetical protein